MRFNEFKILAEAANFILTVPINRACPEVADLQKVLMAIGIDVGPPGIDGVNGKYTTAAIAKFQTAAGIPADGKPNADTIATLNKIMDMKPDIFAQLTKSTVADIKSSSQSFADLEDADVKKLNPIPGGADMLAARDSAAKYLGRTISDDEWNYLVRATVAESSLNKEEYGMVMASILNRARSYGKNGIIVALTAPRQFQAVTGTVANDHKPSKAFTTEPNSTQMKTVIYAALNVLPRVSHDQKDFTAASAAAYGPGTNINYRNKMVAKGGNVVGGTVFNTKLA